MTKLLAGVLALTAVMGFTACGSTEESSSKSGTVSLVTTTTTEAPAEESSEEETTTTTEETTTTTTEETTTTAEETTTTAEETTTTEKETTVSETKIEVREMLSSSVEVKYNSNTVKLGMSGADLVAAIGEPNDKTQVAHCIGEGMDDVYWYNGLNVSVFEDKVVSIELMDNGYSGSESVQTAAGFSLATTAQQFKDKLGDPVSEAEGEMLFEEDGTYAYIMANDAGCTYLLITDMKDAIPGLV